YRLATIRCLDASVPIGLIRRHQFTPGASSATTDGVPFMVPPIGKCSRNVFWETGGWVEDLATSTFSFWSSEIRVAVSPVLEITMKLLPSDMLPPLGTLDERWSYPSLP